VVKVNMGQHTGAMSVYPNPVTDGIIRLHFRNLPAVKYTVRVVSLAGEVLLLKDIIHEGGNSSTKIALPNYIAKGIYHLEVMCQDKETITKINFMNQ